MSNITTIILLAGKSKRFKSNKSKIFHELAGLPIIDHIYLTANKISNNNNIIFVCNEKNIKEIKNRYKNCKFAIQKKQNGTAGAVLSAKKYIKKNSNILILLGDTPLISYLSLNRLINHFYKNKLPGSMLAFNSNNPYSYGRVIINKRNVLEVIEEINATEDIKKISLCNSGVMLCRYNILFNLISNINDKNKKKERYLTDIFKIANYHKRSFEYILCEESEMSGVNTIQDFNNVDAIYQNILKQKLLNKGVNIIEPNTVRISFDTKIDKNSIIEPFVYIKTGVIIKADVVIKSHTVLESTTIEKSSSVGPFARVRPKSFIGKNVKIGNFVEIKNSIIKDNCSIGHLSYIGDSKLGKNVNIGAGTITCNYDGKNKNKTIIEDNVFVGSNCSLVAPITIGRNSKIGAGSVITKNIPPNSLGLERAKLKIMQKTKKK